MTDSKYHNSDDGSREGRVFRPATPAELAEAVDHAFDYRGDVTLTLMSGEMVEGYIFNRNPASPRPVLKLFPKGKPEVREIPYTEVVSIAFTGEDTASGKSWEAWAAKKESERCAEAQKVAEAASARGHL